MGWMSRSMARPTAACATERSYADWRFSQNAGVVRKKRARRKAVTDRGLSRAMMKVIWFGGTCSARAKAFALKLNGFMYSSRSTSPGWVRVLISGIDRIASVTKQGGNVAATVYHAKYPHISPSNRIDDYVVAHRETASARTKFVTLPP